MEIERGGGNLTTHGNREGGWQPNNPWKQRGGFSNLITHGNREGGWRPHQPWK